MVSPRRSTRQEPPARGPAARPGEPPAPLSTPRRLGVVIVVGALLVSILLAFGGSSRPDAPTETATPVPQETRAAIETQGPVASGAPTVAPSIEDPEIPVLTSRELALLITIPDPGVALNTLRLNVYRGEQRVLDGLKVTKRRMTVKKVPLKNGENTITMALENASGEGPRSAPVVITVDAKPPRIEIKSPDSGQTINGSVATLRGQTEPGLVVTIRNPSVGAVQEVTADERGVFSAEVNLGPDSNRIEASARDAAGNTGRQSVTVTRGDGVPQAKLVISEENLKLSSLPTSVNIRFELDDADGNPVDGVTVVFSLSPPGLPTETYETELVNGTARWDDVVIAKDGAVKGFGFVTARAELGAGVPTASATKTFNIR